MRPDTLHDLQCSSNYFGILIDRHNLAAAASGAFAFPATLGVFQYFVWKVLKKAAHMRLAGVCGLFSVCSSVTVSIFVVESVHNLSFGVSPVVALSLRDFVCCMLLAVCHFAIFARSFKVVLPSHILHAGAYAKSGIKVNNYMVKVTDAQRRVIQGLGYKHGCHTCGKRYSKVGRFIKQWLISWIFDKKPRAVYFADHSPPFALAILKSKGRKPIQGTLFPQCQNCSNFQASQVRLAKSSNTSTLPRAGMVAHSTRFRWFKLFLPWPLLVGHIQSVGHSASQYFSTMSK